MDKIYIINYLADKIKAKKYLEIGVDQGFNFENIKIEHKVGVDPYSPYPGVIKETSDDFFKNNTEKFDIVLVDGLHHSDQVYKDIINDDNSSTIRDNLRKTISTKIYDIFNEKIKGYPNTSNEYMVLTKIMHKLKLTMFKNEVMRVAEYIFTTDTL
jgi:hypothetical protein